MPKKRTWTNNELEAAVLDSSSVRQVLGKLRLAPTGGNYKQFYKYAAELNLDMSHFIGKGWRKGNKTPPVKSKPLSEILTKGSFYQSSRLRVRLISEGIFDAVCSRCQNAQWQGVNIPLELEHKNGINTDNRIENLCLLCPNCHALTSTYRGKNKASYSNRQRESA